MRILIDIGHPAHVHFFKNAIRILEENGHDVMVTARNKDVTVYLLKAYNIPHIVLTDMRSGKINLLIEWAIRDLKLLFIAKKFKPDILTGILNPSVAHVSSFLGKKSIIFSDTEHAKFAETITIPFSDVVYTPSCFKKNLGKKQIRYEGFHELAYLHPNYYTPNPAVLDELGLGKNDVFFIIRFVSWRASHDSGQHGIRNKIELISKLEKYGRVLITSEEPLGIELDNFKIKISPEKIHDLLYYASLYIGEGATMATESVILGTPSIYISSLAGTMGNFIELEQKYGLVFSYKDTYEAIIKAIELIQQPDIKGEWRVKRDKLLNNKIDVTALIIRLLENHPESGIEMNDGS